MASRAGMRTVAFAATLAVAVVGCSRQPQASTTPTHHSQPVVTPQPTPSGCAVTIPNGKNPPGEAPSPESHGNDALWTMLPADGIDRIGSLQPDGSISQKYPWHTVGTTGELVIDGRRLDAPASPLRARINSGAPESGFATVAGGRFWASSISFPTEGCWRVTGTVGRTSLTFVVFVAKP